MKSRSQGLRGGGGGGETRCGLEEDQEGPCVRRKEMQ